MARVYVLESTCHHAPVRRNPNVKVGQFYCTECNRPTETRQAREVPVR